MEAAEALARYMRVGAGELGRLAGRCARSARRLGLGDVLIALSAHRLGAVLLTADWRQARFYASIAAGRCGDKPFIYIAVRGPLEDCYVTQQGTKGWLRLLEEHERLDEVAGRAFYVAHMLAEEGVEGAEALLEDCMLAERHGYRFSDYTSMPRTRAP